MSDKKKFTRNVDASTSDDRLVPFVISKEHPFPIAKISSVEAKDADKTGNPYLQFTITDADGKQGFIHREYFNEKDHRSKSGKVTTVEKLNEEQEQRIAHIFNAFFEKPNAHARANDGKGLAPDVSGESAEEATRDFFEKVAKSFNTLRDGKPIYETEDSKPIPVRIRPTFIGTSQGFPRYPNFIERFRENRVTLLRPNAYDNYEPAKKNSGGATIKVDEDNGGSDAGMPPGFDV